MACHIRRDDIVEVITGEHKGQRGKVLKVMPKRQMVLVQGVNMVHRHVRPSRQNPQGGRLQKEAPLHVSNVLPVDEKIGRGARTLSAPYGPGSPEDAGGKALCALAQGRTGITDVFVN